MEFSDVSLLIIAGGKSSRMGRDKRFLSYGGEGLLERLARKAAALPLAARFLCVEESSPALQEIAERYGLTLVEDGVQGRGPDGRIGAWAVPYQDGLRAGHLLRHAVPRA